MKILSTWIAVLSAVALFFPGDHAHALSIENGKILNVTGTGRTVGNVINIEIENTTGQEQEYRFDNMIVPPTVDEATGKRYQAFLLFGLAMRIAAGESAVLPLEGTCLMPDVPPPPDGKPVDADFIELDKSIKLNAPPNLDDYLTDEFSYERYAPIDLEPGDSYLINPASGKPFLVRVPNLFDDRATLEHWAPIIDWSIRNLREARKRLKDKNDLIATPHSSNEELSEQEDLQHTAWRFNALLAGIDEYNDEFFERNVKERFQKQSDRKVEELPEKQQEQFDEGIDNFWNNFSLIGEEAKVYATVEKEAPPVVEEDTNVAENEALIEESSTTMAENGDAGEETIPEAPEKEKTCCDKIREANDGKLIFKKGDYAVELTGNTVKFINDRGGYVGFDVGFDIEERFCGIADDEVIAEFNSISKQANGVESSERVDLMMTGADTTNSPLSRTKMISVGGDHILHSRINEYSFNMMIGENCKVSFSILYEGDYVEEMIAPPVSVNQIYGAFGSDVMQGFAKPGSFEWWAYMADILSQLQSWFAHIENTPIAGFQDNNMNRIIHAWSMWNARFIMASQQLRSSGELTEEEIRVLDDFQELLRAERKNYGEIMMTFHTEIMSCFSKRGIGRQI